MRGFSGPWVENYEPIAWAEELIEPARAVDHPRLAVLYVMASTVLHGRTDRGGCPLQRRRPDGDRQWPPRGVPFGLEGLLGGAYVVIGQPERWVEWCRAQLARGRDTHTFTRACLVFALTSPVAVTRRWPPATGLIDAAEATRNPCALSFALNAYGFACPRRRSRPCTGRLAPGPGDRSRQRQPLNESHAGAQSGPTRGRIRRPAGRVRLLHSGDPQLPRLGQ